MLQYIAILQGDGDSMKQDMQRQQLRELLAKQTLQRQKQKEEKERIMRGDQPLRHWAQDDPGTPPAGQFPHGKHQLLNLR